MRPFCNIYKYPYKKGYFMNESELLQQIINNQKIINNLKMLAYLNSGFQNLKFSKIEEN